MSKYLYNLRIKELKEKYKHTSGIVDFIESNLESEIIALVDEQVIESSLPKTYHKINLIAVNAYSGYKNLSDSIDYYILNEPTLWDNEETHISKSFDALVALSKKYKEAINNYERNKKHGREKHSK